MMSKKSVKKIRTDLIIMCEMFVSGATLNDVCGKTDCTIHTMRARKTILSKIGVKLSRSLRPGRGYGTPVYHLEETLEEAKEKITARYAKEEERGKEKTEPRERTDRDLPVQCGRNDGYGIENWFFITQDRAKAYVKWCDPWTEKVGGK